LIRFLALSDLLANMMQLIVILLVMLIENEWTRVRGYHEPPVETMFGIFLPLWLALLVAGFIWTILIVWYPISPPERKVLYRFHIVAWALPIIIFGTLTLLALNGLSFRIGDHELCKGMWLNVCAFYPITVVCWFFILFTLFGVAMSHKEDRLSLNSIEAEYLTPEELHMQNHMNKRLVLEHGVVFIILLLLPIAALIARFTSHHHLKVSYILFYYITACILPLRGICNAAIVLLFPDVQNFLKGNIGVNHHRHPTEEMARFAM